ncbi:MAG TPA: lamin tail domain-containing protein [Labilithrix sp.]|nr:lamin tail domain-containing protein [Labilithrix sp.]
MLRWVLCGVGLAAVLGMTIACAKGESDADLGDLGVADLDAGGAEAASIALGEGGSIRQQDGATTSEGGGGGSGCTGKVFVNELQSEGASGAEFVELFNPNDCAVALDGWKLDYRSKDNGGNTPLYTFAAKDSIPAGGFFVLGSAGFTGSKDATFTMGGLGNSGGQVGLIDAQDKLIDAVGYMTGTAGPYTEGKPAPNPSSGSIGRKTDGLDTDDNSADFAVTDSPSPGASNL